ncbi:MAG: RadC family protein [Clostridia bacterium]|nr:RadC family protein [Clostridia bacterium]
MEQKKNSHKGHRQRFKLKALEGGIEHWPAHEVMELILMYVIPQKDVNPLAHELIDTFGSISGVLDAGYEQLKEFKGIAHESALFLTLLPDIFLKYNASKNVDRVMMDTTHKCVSHFRNVDRVRNTENFYVFCLDNNKRLIRTFKFDSGLSSAVGVPLTDFVKQISLCNSKSIIVMHSHPSGDSNPTSADIAATKQLIASSHAVGVKFEDHIIVTDRHYYSFLNSNFLRAMKKELNVPDDTDDY